jgi:hypothetical protein
MAVPSEQQYDGVPRYAGIAAWTVISGISRSSTYELIGQGHLVAHKIGRRTLVDVWRGLQWISDQPRAEIGKSAS